MRNDRNKSVKRQHPGLPQDDRSKRHASLPEQFLKACQNGNTKKLLHLLRTAGPQLLVNAVSTTSGSNGFLYACGPGNGEAAVDFLLERDDQLVHSKNNKGMNGLHFACSSGQLNIAKKLTALCPSLLTAIDDRGKSAYDYARDRGHRSIAEWLLNQNAEFFIAHREKNKRSSQSSSSSTSTTTTSSQTTTQTVIDASKFGKCMTLSRALAQLGKTIDFNQDSPNLSSLMMPPPSPLATLQNCEAFLSFTSQKILTESLEFDNKAPVVTRIEKCNTALKKMISAIGIQPERNSELGQYIATI